MYNDYIRYIADIDELWEGKRDKSNPLRKGKVHIFGTQIKI